MRLTFKGACTIFELLDAVARLLADQSYSRDFDGVIDFSAATANLTAAEIGYFAHFVGKHPRAPRGTWGIMVLSPNETALAMLFRQKFASPHLISIFSTPGGARSFFDQRKNRFARVQAAA